MKGVTFDKKRELNQWGYQLVESKDNTKALLLKGKKVLARFERYEEDGVTAKIGKVVCNGISEVNIRKASISGVSVVIELYYPDADSCDDPLWCEILPEGKLIFV